MKTQFLFALLTAIALVSNSTSAAPKPTKQPVQNVKLIREVLGTQQLVGYEGHLGETFTLGKDSPFNFTLRSASYSIGRINVGGYSQFAAGDEKLIILHFTVQNPRKTAFNLTASYLNFQSAYNPTPIIRYDLRGKVSRLVAPFADPSDATGATALKLVPAKIGVFYPVADRLDARIDSIAYTTDPLGGRAPSAGQHYCVATAILQNRGINAINFSQSYFRADLKDADGEKVAYNASIRKGSRDEEAGGKLQPGEIAKVRFYWVLPEKVEAQTALLQYGYDRASRTYAVDVAPKSE